VDSRRRWENDIEIYLKEIGFRGVDWIGFMWLSIVTGDELL
jgi:hypothetical protein